MCLRLTSKEVRSVPPRATRRRTRRAGRSAPASSGVTSRLVFAPASGVAPPGTWAPNAPPPASEVDFAGAVAPPPWAEAAGGRGGGGGGGGPPAPPRAGGRAVTGGGGGWDNAAPG